MAAVPQVTGRELSNPPSDGISSLRFSNHSDHLLVSSWDKVNKNKNLAFLRIHFILSRSLDLQPKSLLFGFKCSVCGQTVRLYDASADVLRGEFTHGGPVLDCCFHDDSSGFSASADNAVRRFVLFVP